MSEKNSNSIQNYQFIQSTEFIDNTSYNPFAPNPNPVNNKAQDNSQQEYQQITRPYLNEIQNQGPNNEINNSSLNHTQASNDIKQSESNDLNLKHTQSYEIRKNNEMVVEFENEIRKEIEQTPLISEKLAIQVLLDDYKSNEEYSNSVKIITEKYKYIRKVRRDGNCFYRSFLYRLFEHICMKNNNSLYNHILKKIEEIKEISKKVGYEWFLIEDFYNVFYGEFCSCFNCISTNEVCVRDYLDNLFMDKEKGNYLIYFIRFCIASYLKENKALYDVYVEGNYEDWINREVEAIDHEADQIQIMACVNYFDIGVKIEYLNPHKNEVVKFPEDKKDEDLFITVLFTPGHYDILYTDD